MQVCVFTYVRTRAYVHVCVGSAEDKAWWNWRHFAGGAGAGVPALVPFPRRISVSEMESLLRFVDDPEDAALLMRWFPLESNPLASSSQVPPTSEASTDTRGKSKSKSMQPPARGPEQGDSPQGTETAQVAPSTGKTIATAGLGQGPAPAPSTSASQVTPLPLPAMESLQSAEDGACESVRRTASMAMFKAPIPVFKTPGAAAAKGEGDTAEADGEEQTVNTDVEAAEAADQAARRARLRPETSSWGVCTKRRVGSPGGGGGGRPCKSMYVQRDVAAMPGQIFAKWAVAKSDLTTRVGAVPALPLAQVCGITRRGLHVCMHAALRVLRLQTRCSSAHPRARAQAGSGRRLDAKVAPIHVAGRVCMKPRARLSMCHATCRALRGGPCFKLTRQSAPHCCPSAPYTLIPASCTLNRSVRVQRVHVSVRERDCKCD